MVKKKEIDELDVDLSIDETVEKTVTSDLKEVIDDIKRSATSNSKKEESHDVIESCLTNERVIIRPVLREDGVINNPKHVYYGGMAANAVKVYCVPRLEGSGNYVNVLTNKEKAFLEQAMGLEKNALSIYLKVNNYWDNVYIRLTKEDNYLDLSIPDDYIKYKVLLSNKDAICPNINTLQESPKRTYKFVIIKENEEVSLKNKELSANMEAYMKLGELQSDIKLLKLIVETVDGRPIAKEDPAIVLAAAQKVISANAKLFIIVANDPYIKTKLLIKEAVEQRVISKRGDFYYLKEGNMPLCADNEEPTLAIASRYLNLPKNQNLRIAIMAQTKK